MLGCTPGSGVVPALLLKHSAGLLPPGEPRQGLPPSSVATAPIQPQHGALPPWGRSRQVRGSTDPSLALTPASANSWLDGLGQMTGRLCVPVSSIVKQG